MSEWHILQNGRTIPDGDAMNEGDAAAHARSLLRAYRDDYPEADNNPFEVVGPGTRYFVKLESEDSIGKTIAVLVFLALVALLVAWLWSRSANLPDNHDHSKDSGKVAR